jgi:hypothetical protein
VSVVVLVTWILLEHVAIRDLLALKKTHLALRLMLKTITERAAAKMSLVATTFVEQSDLICALMMELKPVSTNS